VAQVTPTGTSESDITDAAPSRQTTTFTETDVGRDTRSSLAVALSVIESKLGHSAQYLKAITATTTDDDDSDILPMLIGALKPRCQTPSTFSGVVGQSVTLSVSCTFKGNLARKYVWVGSNIPAAPAKIIPTMGSITLTAPADVGSYSYAVKAYNGNIRRPSIPITLQANAIAPSGCSISGPASLSVNQSGTFTASCTGGSAVTSYA
jgi:hypothetical protein